MKLFVLIVVTLLVTNSLSVQAADSPESITIDKEANQLINLLQSGAVNEVGKFVTAINNRVTQYSQKFYKFSGDLVKVLNSLGSEGQILSDQIDNELHGSFDSLRKQFSAQAIQQQVNSVLNDLKTRYIEPILGDISFLKSAINQKPKAANCWDTQKLPLRLVLQATLAEIQKILQTNAQALDLKIKGIEGKIVRKVQSISGEIRTCSGKQACILKYVSLSKNLVLFGNFLSFLFYSSQTVTLLCCKSSLDIVTKQ